MKYNCAILSSQLNEKRRAIMQEGKELYIEAASRKLVNLVIESSQPSQEEKRTGNGQNQSEKRKSVTFAKNLTTTFNEAGKNQ